MGPPNTPQRSSGKQQIIAFPSPSKIKWAVCDSSYHLVNLWLQPFFGWIHTGRQHKNVIISFCGCYAVHCFISPQKADWIWSYIDLGRNQRRRYCRYDVDVLSGSGFWKFGNLEMIVWFSMYRDAFVHTHSNGVSSTFSQSHTQPFSGPKRIFIFANFCDQSVLPFVKLLHVDVGFACYISVHLLTFLFRREMDFRVWMSEIFHSQNQSWRTARVCVCVWKCNVCVWNMCVYACL